MGRRILTLIALTVAGTAATRARADEPLVPAPSSSAAPTGDTAVECPRCHVGYWTREPDRVFLSITAVAGYLYLKPRFSLGYGRPFAVWGGLDLTPLVTPDYAGAFGGPRLQLPWLDVRAGTRAVHAFTHQFMPRQSSYTLVDLSEDHGQTSNYLGLEAEASAAIPVGPGDVLALGTVSSLQMVPVGSDVYDEALRVIVTGAPVYRGRLGYALRFLPERTLQIGLAGEVIDIPDRQAQVYRAGIVATFDIDDHLQAVGLCFVPLVSPDALGLAGADYTELGIRYRWATGHVHPERESLPPEQVEE